MGVDAEGARREVVYIRGSSLGLSDIAVKNKTGTDTTAIGKRLSS